VGKIAIPSDILCKPGTIRRAEFELIKDHSQLGYELLTQVELHGLIATIVLQHHERLDGSGYPSGLKGNDILVEARVLAVADVVEAMFHHRPYRPALGVEATLAEIEKNRGRLYDPGAVDACLRLFRQKQFRWD
jgi:HD-GYP domain-containing protein (c-di-GMP phosphodiesterase class II)